MRQWSRMVCWQQSFLHRWIGYEHRHTTSHIDEQNKHWTALGEVNSALYGPLRDWYFSTINTCCTLFFNLPHDSGNGSQRLPGGCSGSDDERLKVNVTNDPNLPFCFLCPLILERCRRYLIDTFTIFIVDGALILRPVISEETPMQSEPQRMSQSLRCDDGNGRKGRQVRRESQDIAF